LEVNHFCIKFKATVPSRLLADSIVVKLGTLIFDKNLRHLLPENKINLHLETDFRASSKALSQFPDFEDLELLHRFGDKSAD